VPSTDGKQAWSGGYPSLRDLLRETMTCVAALHEAIRGLPEVDEDGRSECPFAEKLYAQTEGRIDRLGQLSGLLHSSLAETQKEIRRCGRNRNIVVDDHRRLHGAEARARYVNADDLLARQHRAHLRDRDEILAALKAVDEALDVAYGRLFPGRKPRDGPEPWQALLAGEAEPAPPLLADVAPGLGRIPPVGQEQVRRTPSRDESARGRPPGAPVREHPEAPGMADALHGMRGALRQSPTPHTALRGELADVISLEAQRGRAGQPADAQPRTIPGGTPP